MQAFMIYYSRLYSPIPTYETQILIDLLDSLQIPVLLDEVVARLGDLFT